jgi:UPF0176 protein
MQKILLYYKFTPIPDPEAIKLWQRTLCESLNLRGRILISRHGINGTVGGEINDLKRYIKQTKQYPGFKDTEFKWSHGKREDFPRLSVRHRRELVGFRNSEDEFEVDEHGVVGGGKHITPQQVHELVETYGDEVVFFDGRNEHEARLGKFKNAIVPNTKTSRDFIAELESDKYDHIKDKKVITYCTGGIRCEVLSAMMLKRGFKEIYQIDGGIVKYGEAYGDNGLWEGGLRVFDDRKVITFTPEAKPIAQCEQCGAQTFNFENCAWPECDYLMILCEACAAKSEMHFHSPECREQATHTNRYRIKRARSE